VNVGTAVRFPTFRAFQVRWVGLVRRRPMTRRWGGGAVVVRAGESLAHGEGPQRIDAAAMFHSLQSSYPDVFMVSSNDYSSFVYSNYYVAMVPREFPTAAGANAWCDSEGFSADNCFAKRLSHNDGPDGNSVERG
jgi:hypothetical protein